jgi:aminoglycoside phosphotransferase (APT) family kinase protein
MRMVFGHNRLNPANFIDDGDRLWLVDWEQAGFGTAAFDLANLSANCGFGPPDDRRLLDTYFGGSTSHDVQRSFAAMKAASSLRDALGAAVLDAHAPSSGVDHGVRAARSMKIFEALYAEFLDKF